MKFTEKSKLLMNFFKRKKYINNENNTKRTNNILTELYNEIFDSYEYLQSIKKNKGDKFYNSNIRKINNVSQISKPSTFNYKHFPQSIINHIDETSMNEIIYKFDIFERNIKIIFVIEDITIENNIISLYNDYVDKIIQWFYILNEYDTKQCSKSIVIYLYMTSLEKKIPNLKINVLDETNINTAFTTTCIVDSEIVIYRKEEWFKVLIHESFHNFNMDFSGMNTDLCNKCILSIFPVDSNVNLYESYAEFWAEIVNALFCSFISLKNKTDLDRFLENSNYFINYERKYSFFQLSKALNYMGLKYIDLYDDTEYSESLRNTMYKEKTNVLSYFVIKTILMNNFQSFLYWCKTNNLSLMQFKKTNDNQIEFCNFIHKKYKSKSMIKNIDSTDYLLKKINKTYIQQVEPSQNIDFILTNMRMSLCELG